MAGERGGCESAGSGQLCWLQSVTSGLTWFCQPCPSSWACLARWQGRGASWNVGWLEPMRPPSGSLSHACLGAEAERLEVGSPPLDRPSSSILACWAGGLRVPVSAWWSPGGMVPVHYAVLFAYVICPLLWYGSSREGMSHGSWGVSGHLSQGLPHKVV